MITHGKVASSSLFNPGLHTPPSGASLSAISFAAAGPVAFCSPIKKLVNPYGAAGGVSVRATMLALVASSMTVYVADVACTSTHVDPRE